METLTALDEVTCHRNCELKMAAAMAMYQASLAQANMSELEQAATGIKTSPSCQSRPGTITFA